MTDTSPTPAPTPASKSLAQTAKTILTDVEVGLGAIVTIGEGVLLSLPSGPVHDAFAVGLPILAAFVAGLRRIG